MSNLKINEDFKIVENFDDQETPLMICYCEEDDHHDAGFYLCYESDGFFYLDSDGSPDFYASIEELILDYYDLKFHIPSNPVEKQQILEKIKEVNFFDY